jgi:hypothetical protein
VDFGIIQPRVLVKFPQHRFIGAREFLVKDYRLGAEANLSLSPIMIRKFAPILTLSTAPSKQPRQKPALNQRPPAARNKG